uniref:Uncharacterized protein n=1 Tax=Romanomermis culicivorax TaxID=13658 RepID=A0A915IXD6_ROMCU
MTTPSTSSASTADKPPPYRELINVKERYPYARAHGQPPQSHHRQVVAPDPPQPAAALTSAYDNCFDFRIRQLLSSHYHSPIQLPKCAHQSDIAARATVPLGRVSLFRTASNATFFLGSTLQSPF